MDWKQALQFSRDNLNALQSQAESIQASKLRTFSNDEVVPERINKVFDG